MSRPKTFGMTLVVALRQAQLVIDE